MNNKNHELISAFDHLGVGIAYFNPEGLLEYINSQVLNFFLSFEDVGEAIGLSYEMFLRKIVADGNIGGSQALADPDGWVREHLMRHDGHGVDIDQLSDGRRIRTEVQATDDGGITVQWTDVTDFFRNEMRLTSASNCIGDGFGIWGQNNRLELFTPEFAANHGLDGIMSVGMSIDEVIFAVANSGLLNFEASPAEWIARRLESWKLPDHQEVYEYGDGKYLKVHDRRSGDGSMITVMIDVTELKMKEAELIFRGETLEKANFDLELSRQAVEHQATKLVEMSEQNQIVIEELQRSQIELEEKTDLAEIASRSKSAFLATMSHEIRTPMTGVIGFADALLDEDLPESSRSMVYSIKNSTQNLLSILNEILDLSKLEAGKMEIERIDFDVPWLLGDIVSMFEGSGGNSTTIDLEISDDFPASANGDPTRIRQVLVNLLGNALKFTKRGRVSVAGDLKRCEGASDKLHFTVRDTGIGIPQETIPKLFMEFTQADASITREFEGTGLGLSICKRLVELMGGEIGVESELGVGSTFWFTVPYVAATSAVKAGVGPISPGDDEVKTKRSLNILVAEDNAVNQMIISKTLDAFGHKYKIVENGEEAVIAHDAAVFDMILMDVRMPKVSGPDATRMIRQMSGEKAKIPIVALTADAMAEHQIGYFEAGMNAVATKPIVRTALAATINAAMDAEIHTFEDVVVDAVSPPTDGEDESDQQTNAAVDDFMAQINAITASE